MKLIQQHIALRRSIFRSSIKPNSLSFKYYSSVPPRKSYNANLTPLQLFWNNKVSINIKYFGIVVSSAYSITHIHPNTLVTVGPPVLLSSYYLYKRWFKNQFLNQTKKILPTSKLELESINDRIRIKKYDESELSNVLNGIENQFGHFKRQIIDVLERRIIDYVILNKEKEFSMISLLIDENNQFSININENDIETFIVSKVSLSDFEQENEISSNENGNNNSQLVDFIKFSLPFYSSKDFKTRERLGVIQVHLLEIPNKMEERNYIEYKIAIEISPYKFLVRDSDKLFIKNIQGKDVYKSKILLDDEKKPNHKKEEKEEEEITVNM